MCVLCYLCIALHPHNTTCKFAARRMTMYRAARRIPDLLCALQTYRITCGRRRMVDSLPARKLCTGLREPPRFFCALRMYRELMPHASDLQPLRKLCTEVREGPQSFAALRMYCASPNYHYMQATPHGGLAAWQTTMYRTSHKGLRTTSTPRGNTAALDNRFAHPA